jgi:tetratricopeptide (TPR) repeat protein
MCIRRNVQLIIERKCGKQMREINEKKAELLNQAILLSEDREYLRANALLLQLASDHPDDSLILYHCACSFDALGKEHDAVPFYEQAIAKGLSGRDLEGAYLGLGSTYRTIGDYEKSRLVLQKGIEHFPENQALRVFLALTLYNLNEHRRAVESLLQVLLETSDDQNILRYKRALSFYANRLDSIWNKDGKETKRNN